MVVQPRCLPREVVALGQGGGAVGSVAVEACSLVRVTGLLVQVRRNSRVPRDIGVHLGERGQPGLSAIRLADRDRAVEADDRAVREAQQLVVPADDLDPVGLVVRARIGVQGGDGGLGLVLAEVVAGEGGLEDLDGIAR